MAFQSQLRLCGQWKLLQTEDIWNTLAQYPSDTSNTRVSNSMKRLYRANPNTHTYTHRHIRFPSFNKSFIFASCNLLIGKTLQWYFLYWHVSRRDHRRIKNDFFFQSFRSLLWGSHPLEKTRPTTHAANTHVVSYRISINSYLEKRHTFFMSRFKRREKKAHQRWCW